MKVLFNKKTIAIYRIGVRYSVLITFREGSHREDVFSFVYLSLPDCSSDSVKMIYHGTYVSNLYTWNIEVHTLLRRRESDLLWRGGAHRIAHHRLQCTNAVRL